MRPVLAAAAVAGLAAIGFFVAAAGHRLVAARGPGDDVTAIVAEPLPVAPPGTRTDPAPVAAPPPGPARPIAPDVVAPPEIDPAALERAEAREPLSELALALPPKALPPDQWEGTPLYRPLADAAGRFSAMGHTVVLAGLVPVEPDERCGPEGQAWACGARARTAFRQWIRGRALICLVPPQAEPRPVVAACRIGKQDAAAWLVANGWARAVPGGPYAGAEAVARKERMGIFGDPPPALGFTASTSLPDSPVPAQELPDGIFGRDAPGAAGSPAAAAD